MSDNTQFWKDLLGDDYEQLMDIVKPEQPGAARQGKPAGKPEVKPMSGADHIVDINKARGADIGRTAPKPEPTPPPAANRPGRTPAEPGPKLVSDQGARAAGKPDEVSPASKKSGSSRPEDDFQVNFDFDGEYGDLPEKTRQPQPQKRSGCFGGALFAVLIIAVSLLLASLGWLAATDVLGLGEENERVQVTVPEDYTIKSIADTLYEKGLIKYKLLFKFYAGFSDADKKITPGTFVLDKNYDYRALVNGMNIHGGKRVEIDVTIPEGYTLKQTFELLAANSVCTEKELWDTAANEDFQYDFLDKSTLGDKHRLEGYLFPDTYGFYVGDSPSRVITKMLSNFNKKFKDEYVTRAKSLGYSVRDIVTIAAMIEKEAGVDSERDLIASVIYNRLKSSSFPYLQIDATIYYAIAETGEGFSTDIDSPYNTYNHKGLPAGPIANPGIASIKAALYPKTTSFYYYALNKNGSHDFFTNAAAFNAFISSDKYGG